jgi:hypothetical protein
MESIMWTLLNLIYRQSVRASLIEMRQASSFRL